jgi:CheY-like chemotaxis protein
VRTDLGAAPQLEIQSGEAEALSGRQLPAGAPPRTLLYVEDNPANMKLVEQLIARCPDMRLLTAVNGTLGIELARAAQPQVILMDINLPASAVVISFGGDGNVEIMGEWTDAMDFTPPELLAGGLTPLGAAMRCALDEVESQKSEMRTAGVSYKRPIVMLLSDGEPTDDWRQIAADCKSAETAHKVNIMAIGIGDKANKETLGNSATRAR